MFDWQSQNAAKSSPTSSPYSPVVETTKSNQAITKLVDASQPKHTAASTGKRVNDSDETNHEDVKLSLDSNHLEEGQFPSTFDSDHLAPPTIGDTSRQSSSKPKPRRVDSLSMTSARHRPYDSSQRRPSPPSIATLAQSPSPSVSSLDRSAVSTPPIRRSPPPGSMQPATMHYSYTSDPPLMQAPRAPQNPHFSARGESMTQVYGYNAHSSFDNRYESNEPSVHSQHHLYPGMPSHHTVPSMSHISGNPTRDTFGIPYPLPGQTNVSVVHTDDASTKLSDRVRRRCFNCRTTDTSTWRRSNLSPGKVLCNKCGLFERTHSRPRPEQFPHKRGPLSTSTLGPRTPPSNQLPPITPSYHYSQPSIAPLTSVPESRRQHSNTLPEIHSWLDEPGAHSTAPVRRTLEPSLLTRQPTPPSASGQHAPPEIRDPPSARESRG